MCHQQCSATRYNTTCCHTAEYSIAHSITHHQPHQVPNLALNDDPADSKGDQSARSSNLANDLLWEDTQFQRCDTTDDAFLKAEPHEFSRTASADSIGSNGGTGRRGRRSNRSLPTFTRYQHMCRRVLAADAEIALLTQMRGRYEAQILRLEKVSCLSFATQVRQASNP